MIGERDSFYGNASVGLPLPGVEVRIDNADENGIGEIVTRGDNVMLGYFRDEQATERHLRDGCSIPAIWAERARRRIHHRRLKNS